MAQPLMPKATAVWLIEKTSLTFEQVADFVGMHPLEVQAIADGEVAQGIIGYDPVLNGQLTREEIARLARVLADAGLSPASGATGDWSPTMHEEMATVLDSKGESIAARGHRLRALEKRSGRP